MKSELRRLRTEYPHRISRELAADLRRSLSAVYGMADILGIHKSAAFLASPNAHRFDGRKGIGTRFKPGQTPWNAGKHYQPGGRCRDTQFKPGNRPHTWHPIGHERVTKDGILQRKVTDTGYTPRDYRAVHALVYEQHFGLIPRGRIVVFRDRDRRHFDTANLECITRAENMRRNSYQRYPKEIALAIQLRGALIHRINNRGKREEQDRRSA
jgi:hypothetical protein